MRKYILTIIQLIFGLIAFSQQGGILSLKPSEIEALFLKQNLQLLAEKMDINLADASIAQAKIWDNPSLSLQEVNLWSSNSQREGVSEVIPPLIGSFGRNLQFSFELNQLIQTANKRGKLVEREKAAKNIQIQEFEIILRGLKTELRKSIYEITYLQDYLKTIDRQKTSIEQLVESYRKQVSLGNIAKTELLRLQSSLLALDQEENETKESLNAQLSKIKTYLAMDANSKIQLLEEQHTYLTPESLKIPNLLEETVANKSEIILEKLTTNYHDKSLTYERALKTPDLEFGVSYDRFSSVWKDFVGFSVKMDLPLFNRNQAGIKSANIQREQSIIREQQQINLAQNQTIEAYQNYSQAFYLFQKIHSNPLLNELDDLLSIYSKNLLNKNISMLEFIDFMETYRNNKNTLFLSRKNMQVQFEELQYMVGKEIINPI